MLGFSFLKAMRLACRSENKLLLFERAVQTVTCKGRQKVCDDRSPLSEASQGNVLLCELPGSFLIPSRHVAAV